MTATGGLFVAAPSILRALTCDGVPIKDIRQCTATDARSSGFLRGDLARRLLLVDPLIHRMLTLSVIFNQSVQNSQEQLVIARSSASQGPGATHLALFKVY
jgi:hypothetical protein